MQNQYKGRYQRIERIGSGAFGVIYKIKSIPQGKTLIAKHIPLFNLQKTKALQEFKILQKLKHHYIVRYEDSFSQQDQLVIIMQYCGEKDLAWHIQQRKKSGKHFSQYLVTNWILQLLLAVGFMHTNKIVHRDLKPQNVFVDYDMNLKIGDFGISRILDNTAQHCQTSAGTPSYMAPQIVDSQEYNFKADIWSLGCIIWQICSLQRLFPMKDENDKPMGLMKILDLIKHKQIKDVPSLYSQDLCKLVKKLLIRIPQKRPKAEDLLKDKLLVQLMINRINQKDNLKHQYTKGNEVPSLTNSLLDRQANAIKQQLRKLQLEVQQKMHSFKKKKVEKNQIQSFQKQIKKKMNEVQNAVKLAFKSLYKNGKFGQQPNKSQIEQIKNSCSKNSNSNKSGLSNDSLQNSSDITIQSVELQSNRQFQKNQSDLSLVQSGMIETKNIKINKLQPQKSKVQSKNKLISSIKKNSSLREQSRKIQDFQTTLQSEFTNTIQTDYLKSGKDPDILSTTINKLDLLKNTLKNNPEAVLSNSFLNCTLSMSTDPMIQSLKKQKGHNLSATDSLQFQFTNTLSPAHKTTKVHEFQKKEKSTEQHNQYHQDFEDYNQNEELNQRRQAQIDSMLALYEQELSRQESFNAMSQGFKYRNKYLVMSQIKEQSYEGGSMISKNQSID